MHVARLLLELLQVLGRVVDKEILVHDVVAREQYPDGSRERKTAVAPVGGQAFIAHVRRHLARQIVRIGQGVQAEAVVADLHLCGPEREVLQAGRFLLREREILLDDARAVFRPGNFVFPHPRDTDKAAVVDDALKLVATLQETCHRILVLHLFRNDEIPGECREIALGTATFLRRLGQKEVACVPQIRSLIEMPFKGTGEETEVVPLDVGRVVLLDEPVLPVHDAVIRQYLYRFRPCRVDGLVFVPRHREEFGQFHLIGYRNIRVLADDAVVFHRQNRKLAFQRGCLHYISHALRVLWLRENNRKKALRLMMYRGWLPRACNFIRPYSPNLALRWNVPHTSREADRIPNAMQVHCPTPAMYMTTKITNTASSPPAKTNRYMLFNPLNSGLRPIPLLIEYSAILQEE